MNGALLSSKNMGWCTPADFFSELDQEFHFNLDPAATDKSAKCARYFTPADDGLKADWGGCRVFCNPPYGRQITDWVRKGYEESKKPGTLVVMLIPARTDTSYFHDYIFHGKADEVRFIRGRLTFTDEDGNPTKDAKGRPCSAPFPSAVVIWRSKDMAQSLRDMVLDLIKDRDMKRRYFMGTNQTTKETRRASYDAVIPKAKERGRLILETLGSRSMTVSEITDELVKAGRIPYYNRNYVAPRLSELKDMGVVETCGRRRSTHSTATEAVWRRKEVEHDSP